MRSTIHKGVAVVLALAGSAAAFGQAAVPPAFEVASVQPIIDSTGLNGVYQFNVELPLDARIVSMLIREGKLTDPTGVSPFSAMESLGLKLQRREAPIDVVVVDKLERTPTEN
jgi:uncharacterized protein (TIGR03435 family)